MIRVTVVFTGIKCNQHTCQSYRNRDFIYLDMYYVYKNVLFKTSGEGIPGIHLDTNSKFSLVLTTSLVIYSCDYRNNIISRKMHFVRPSK